MPFSVRRPTPSPSMLRASCHPALRAGRRPAGLAGVVALALTAACAGGNDPFAPRASLNTTLDTLTVYPYSGPQPLLPAGLDLLGRRAVRPAVLAGSVNFDLAFDRNAAGDVVLYPARALAIPPSASAASGAPQTGFQVVTTAFDALETAPRNGYLADTIVTVRVGQTVAIEGQGITGGQLICGNTRLLYAKLVVDSVNTATGALFLRVRTNPNCGFRSLRPGVPND